MHVRNAAAAARLADRLPATYMVFDVLRLDGKRPHAASRSGSGARSCAASGWSTPRGRCPTRTTTARCCSTPPSSRGSRASSASGSTSRYVFGERTRNWLKFAHRHRRSYVVGGWRPQEGTTDRLAALLVGEPTPDGLLYRGRVGSGIGAAASRALTPLVAPLARGDSPFADEVPRVDAARHPLGRAGARRRRRDPRRSATPGCASRRTAGVRTDLTPEDLRSDACARRLLRLLAASLAWLPARAADAPAGAERRTIACSTACGSSSARAPQQVVTVNHTGGYRARVTFWQAHRPGWRSAVRQPTDGRIGYGGLVRGPAARQGTGTTPLGTYGLPWAFGMHAAPTTGGSCATARSSAATTGCRTTRRAYYNRYRNQAAGRLPLVAADERPGQLRAAHRLPPPVRLVDRHRLQHRAGPAPRRRDLPARQRRAARPPAA